MQRYVQQLLMDIADATQNYQEPFAEKEVSLHDWVSAEEEEATAHVRNLCEWTGITSDMLPPASMLGENELHQLLESIKKMLEAYNCHFVLQTEVPEQLQYEAIRQNINQDVKVREWHMGFLKCVSLALNQKAVRWVNIVSVLFMRSYFQDR